MKTKLSLGFYVSALAGVIEIAGLVAYGVMATDGRAAPVSVWVVAILGLLAQAGALALSLKGDGLVPDLLGLAAGVLYACAPILMIKARMAVVVNVFANHVLGETIGTALVAAAVLFLAAVVVKIISGFMPLSKNNA